MRSAAGRLVAAVLCLALGLLVLPGEALGEAKLRSDEGPATEASEVPRDATAPSAPGGRPRVAPARRAPAAAAPRALACRGAPGALAPDLARRNGAGVDLRC